MSNIPWWRVVGSVQRTDFPYDVHIALKKRAEDGERKYKSSSVGFQGDPLEHAWEEALDALFYIWYAKRERNDLLERLSAHRGFDNG